MVPAVPEVPEPVEGVEGSQSINMMRRRLYITFLILLSLFTTACTKRIIGPRLYLDNDFYWAIGEKETTVEDAELLDFQKLPKLEYKNIRYLPGEGNEGKYVWLKVQFTIPDELKNDDLSMLIPYLHFAEELYLNGEYIDDYGVIGEGAEDPDVQEAGLIAHLFDFPEKFLNQEGQNTVLIRVLALGNTSITSGVYLGLRDDCWATSDIMTFWRTRIYIFLEGFMLCICIFFLMIFIAYRAERINLYFSLLTAFSIMFFSGFFGGDLPWVGFHGGLSYLTFYKISKCISFFCLEYVFGLFVFDYLKLKHNMAERIIRCLFLVTSNVVTIVAPNYHSLITFSHIVIWFSLVDVSISVGIIIRNIHKGEKREDARMLFLGLSPMIVCIITDFVLKTFFNNITLPYFSMFGWVLSMIIFFLYFSSQYNRIADRLEYLNKNLKDEVDIQTSKLKDANRKLELERDIANKDMHMAALVQQKFFHEPEQSFKKWDLSVCYEPLAEVSGDLFNFYYDNSNLEGISLFDASGHGVAASLITMLAENVIRQVYVDTKDKKQKLSKSLSDINENFIQAKGDVDNYLTGMLLHMDEKEDGNCTVRISNAAHPYPLVYKKKMKQVFEITPPPGKESYGPIGIKELETSYIDYDFEIEKGDIIVLYTDGLAETMDSSRDEFGKERIAKVLIEENRKGSDGIMQSLIQSLNQHSGPELRSDDVTVIILKRK